MNRFSYVITSLVVCFGICASECDPLPESVQCDFVQNSKCDCNESMDMPDCTKNYCSYPCLSDEWTYHASVDWLYWKPFSEGYEWALTNQQVHLDNNSSLQRVYVEPRPLNLEFDFCSNWRIKGGLNQFDTGRDITVKFAHVEDHVRGRKVAFGNNIQQTGVEIWGMQAYRSWTLGTDTRANPGTAEAKKTIKYYVADLEFGKIFWNQSPVGMRMQVGVRALNLRNKLKITFADANVGSIPNYSYSGINANEIKSQFEGAGLRFGSMFQFSLLDNFTWKNELNAALVLGEFTLKQSEIYNQTIGHIVPQPESATAQAIDLKQMVLKPNVQLNTELGYTFVRPSSQISIKIGYEIDYWFNMNQSTRYTSIGNEAPPDRANPYYVREKGDVYFHGVYGEGGISF